MYASLYKPEPKYQKLLTRYHKLHLETTAILEKLKVIAAQLRKARESYAKNSKAAFGKLEGLSEEEQDAVIGEFVDHIYEHTKPMVKLREIGESYADLVGDFYNAIMKLQGRDWVD